MDFLYAHGAVLLRGGGSARVEKYMRGLYAGYCTGYFRT
jgi:hypothetical protein